MSKRKELQEQRRKEERKRTTIIFGVIAVLAILLIGGAILLSNASQPKQPDITASTKSIPPNAEKNGRAWGPADAPLKIEEYLDYQCPACGSFFSGFEKGVVDAFASTGKVRYEVKFMPFIETGIAGGRESRDAAQSTLCAADQNKFWEMHAALFTNQNGENKGGFYKPRLKLIAATINGLDTAAFNTCLDSNKYEQDVMNELNAGQTRKVNSTPSFFVNNKLYAGARSAADFKKIFAELRPDIKFE